MKSIALCMDTHVCRQMLFYRLVKTDEDCYILTLITIKNINNQILFYLNKYIFIYL